MIASYLACGGFAQGREVSEAEALWTSAQQQAPRLRPPFDARWFADLLATHTVSGATGVQRTPPLTTDEPVRARAPRSQDWGEAPDSLGFVGRAAELATLSAWAVDERSRLIAVLGMGGIGKSTLATRLARGLAPSFERVYWRSVRNAPSFLEWSGGAIAFVSDQRQLPPDGDEARLAVLLELLRERRCLLVPRASAGAPPVRR